MSTTPNFNLFKPGPTDHPDPVVDIAANMDLIDSAIAAETASRAAADSAHAASATAHIGTYVPVGTGVTRLAGTATPAASLPFLNVKDYGAKGDGVWINDVGIVNGSPTITAPSSIFVPADAGKPITLCSQVSNGSVGFFATPHATTIATYVSTTQVTLTVAPSFTATGRAVWGTDDTVAIQAAISAAGSASDTTAAMFTQNGGTVWFPKGMYITTAQLSNYSEVTLRGQLGSPGHAHYEASGSVIRAAATMAAVVNMAATFGARLESLTVDGGNLATSAVKRTGYQNIIRGCEIRRGTTYGVYIAADAQGHENNTFESVIAQDARGIGIYSESCPDNLVMSNVIKGATAGALYLKQSAACQVIGNHFYVLPNHETLTVGHVFIEDTRLTVFRANYVDIVAGGPQMTVISTGAAQLCDANGITDNLFYCASTNVADNSLAHILLQSSGGGVVRSTLVDGNMFMGGTTGASQGRMKYAVQIVGSPTVTVFTNNILRNVLNFWVTNFRPEVVSGNYVDQSGGGPTEVNGATTFSGDGTTVAFAFNHGLPFAPRYVNVVPKSADALGHYYVTVSSTQITITYDTLSAPIAGTNNVLFWYEAGI